MRRPYSYHRSVTPAPAYNRAAYALFQVLSVASIILYIASSLLGDFFNGMGFPLNQPLLLGTATGLGLGAFLTRMVFDPEYGRTLRLNIVLPLGGIWFLLLISALMRGYEVADNVLTYGPIVAICLTGTNRNVLLLLLTSVLLLSLAIQFYEVATGRYLFIVESFGVWLNESLNSGTLGFVRSKGLFAAPTVAAAFAIMCFAILPRSRWLLFVILATGVLTTARTAFLFGILYSVAWFIFLDAKRKAVYSPAAIGVVLISFLGLAVAALDPRLARLTNISVSGDTSNLDRFKYWLDSLNLFKNYGTVEKLLGAPRETYRIWVGATESQPLQYLVDTGVIGFGLYLFALGVTAWRLRFETPHRKAAFAAFCAISAVTPLYNQAGMNILFWLYIYGVWATSRSTRLPEPAGTVRPGKMLMPWQRAVTS